MMSGVYPKSGSGVSGLVSSLLSHALVLRWPLRLCGEYLRRRLVSPKPASAPSISEARHYAMPASDIPASAYAGFGRSLESPKPASEYLRSRHLRRISLVLVL